MMKKLLCAAAARLMALPCSSCAQEEPVLPEPKTSQMKAICELSVMDCYYHTVAKYYEEDASSFLWWTYDKNFWIEYSGVVTLGVDASQVEITVNDTEVTITMPEAKVLGCKVDSSSLTSDSFIVAKDSAAIEAEDEVQAFAAAQSFLEEAAANDSALLANAQQRAQLLLKDYVAGISEAAGKEYTISWVYLKEDGEPSSEGAADTAAESAPQAVSAASDGA